MTRVPPDDAAPHTEATLDPNRPLASAGTPAGSRFVALYEIGRQLLERREVIGQIQKSLVEHLKPEHACVPAVGKDGAP